MCDAVRRGQKIAVSMKAPLRPLLQILCQNGIHSLVGVFHLKIDHKYVTVIDIAFSGLMADMDN